MLLKHCHSCNDAGLSAGRERMQLQVRRDEGSSEFRVCGSTGAGAPDLGGDEMELLAVLCGEFVSL